MKREIRVGGTVVFFGLLTLMGCGRTVVDTTVEQPTQTVEITVDDPVTGPVVDVPTVEPTADVSDNTTVEPEEDKFEDATFIQTGEHEYTINIDCPDNSAEILDPASVPFYEDSLIGTSDGYGVSSELINAIFTYGLQADPANPTHANIESYIDNPVLVNAHYFGSAYMVFTDDFSQYPDTADYCICSASNLSGVGHVSPNTEQCVACAIILKDAMVKCNGNLSCALGVYSMGSDWDIAMQECKDATGLTDEEIYANYGAEFVLAYDKQGLGDIVFINGVLQYINSSITISYYDENGHTISSDTYSLERVKT